jgi:uroporphyrin-3 C-methyltransferase
MTSEPATSPNETANIAVPNAGDAAKSAAGTKWMLAVAAVAVAGLVAGGMAWQRVNAIQEQLARQSADAISDAGVARATAKQAQDLALETAAKLAVTEAKLAEVSLQRTQLEELMQSLARSRDENLIVDIESALRLAQQQSQLTGSLEPLLAALRSAEVRVTRASQPRLAHVQRAIARDTGRVKATALADMPALLAKLDELVTLADDMPVANAVTVAKPVVESAKRKPDEPVSTWWARLGLLVRDEIKGLVRVSRIEDPDAALLTPEQAFFVRENLKLKLLNARLGLLSRQNDAARSDLASAAQAAAKYFDGTSRKTQTANTLLVQVQAQTRSLEIPRIDETLAALSTAAAGR